MKQYIDKSVIVAEIENRKRKLLDHIISESDKEWAIRTAHQLNRIIRFIDTLKVTEVDLDEEIEKYLLANAKLLIEGDSKLVVHHIAEHFFKLGIQQAQKED